MNFHQLNEFLKRHDQQHVLHFWDELDATQREALTAQIQKIDFALLNRLIKNANKENGESSRQMLPAPVISLEEQQQLDKAMRLKGEDLLRKGILVAFLVAGGQGSRLGFDGPKGILPITPIRKKTLFQLHAEKILASAQYYKVCIPWYIMTSEANHVQTVNYFEENSYFGLGKENIMFFKQEMLPAVDLNGKLILEEKHKLFMSPNGHGGSLKAIWDSGALTDMKQRGIEYLFYFQVDNVLLNICEPEFIGYHVANQAQMSSKVVRKAYPEEKMGVM